MSLYAAAGIDYDVLDAGKRAAVAAALSTTEFGRACGAGPIDASRGESAFVFKLGDRYLAQVLECLGTKSSIARAYQDATGENRFAAIGYDSVAAIVNDIVCVGAMPLVVNAYFSTGSAAWYQVEGRFEALVQGWRDACRDAGATWGGGESPSLPGIVSETEIDLAGSAVGAVPEGHNPILGEELSAGDEIVFVASSGLHANGASLGRRLADELPEGYSTAMPSGVAFGDGLLAPSALYVGVVEEALRANLPVTYISHITGHGFRKIMRASKSFTYRIKTLPEVPEVLRFMQASLKMSADEAYGTFNMGAGFAIFCAEGSGADVVAAAERAGHQALVAGVVEDGARRVIVEPIGVTYGDEDLQLR